MDQKFISKRLAEAKRHAREGVLRIARQKRIFATLKLAQRDARLAIAILETMQALQATAEKRCARLERQAQAMDISSATEKGRLRVVS